MPDLKKLRELIKPSKTDNGDGMSASVLIIGKTILTTRKPYLLLFSPFI